MPATVDVIDTAIKAATAYARPDLAERLRHSRSRVLGTEIRVLVVGEFKQGKSQLVNALVGAPVCPVADDIMTVVPSIVRYAQEPSAVVVSGDPDAPPGSWRRAAVQIDLLAGHASTMVEASALARLRHVEVGIPRQILADGLVLVDTPGVGGTTTAHRAATMSALAEADAVLFVSDASQEYTETELEFLAQTAELCPTVMTVVTKIDLYPSWREITRQNSLRVAEAGIHTELLAVSSALRLHAVRTGDGDLNRESGFPVLVSRLRDGVVAQADLIGTRSAAHDVLTVVGQLSRGLRSELTALKDPDLAGPVIAELERARTRATELRQNSARWQQTLNDGVSDLIADIDHDLRDRLREVMRVAEAELDTADPAKVGEELGDWLREEIESCVVATSAWMSRRARWLTLEVSKHFADASDEPAPMSWELGAIALDQLATGPDAMTGERFGIGQKLLVGMRGGYGGTLMFGMLGSLAGFALVNPVSVAAGLLLGSKTVREEKKRLVQRRQAETKNAIRRHIDDVIFQQSKQCRDLLRDIQRGLRDHFTTRAEQLQRSIADSLAAAQQAAKLDSTAKTRRIADLAAELDRVANLESMAHKLVATQERG
jgi:dynamin family protein